MAETSARQQTRIDPAPAWTVLTDAPLKGLVLAREGGTILAWDERDQSYLIDLRGQHRSVSRAPDRILAGTISDDGSVIALLGEGNRLWLFGPDLELVADRQAPPESSCLGIDPHGRYIAVGTRLSLTQFYTRQGRQAGRFETRQAPAHLVFVPDRPFLLASATYGMLVGVALRRGGGPGRLDAEVAWEEALMSNVGRLATTGDGGMVLASCFTHGIQRYDLAGVNEGSYHLGGTTAHAVPDFAGRLIAVATLEGELAVLSSAGNVRWRSQLARPALALATDPLGRYLIYGQSTGEIVRLDLYGGSGRTAPSPAPAPAPARAHAQAQAQAQASGAGAGAGAKATAGRSAGGSAVRTPDWIRPVASSDEQAETAVLAVLDVPGRIGMIANTHRLQVFHIDGQPLGQAPEVVGVGRIVRTAPGWIAAATDRQVVLYDARRNTAQRLDLSLVEVTHLAIRPDSYGLAFVQERDRIGRATSAGRWVWRRELAVPVEDLAIGAEGLTAITTGDGLLQVFDAGGEPSGVVPLDGPHDPACLIEAPEGSPGGIAWLTLSRRAQVLRGHDRSGAVAWDAHVPWEGWQMQRLGSIALVTAPDGRALAFDGSGRLRGQGGGSEASSEVFGASLQGDAWRVSRQGVHLICSDLDGRVRWRAVAEQPLGPLAVGHSGVAVLIGRSLAWFSNAEP